MNFNCNKACLLIFVVIVSFVFSNSQDLFLVNRYNPNKYYCITNSSYALSWIDTDLSSDVDFEASRFLPITEKYWNFTCTDGLSSPSLKCQTSLSEEIILDRRWEALRVYKTDYKDKSPTLTKVPLPLGKNFSVPFSIRTEKEAHLFLCEGNNVTESNCYLISIEINNIELRKCPKATVDLENKTCKSDKNIEILRASNNDSDTDNLKKTAWKHYKLSKIKNNLILYFENNGESKEVMTYKDEKNSYNVTDLIIHSNLAVGRWKFHERTYFYTTEIVNEALLGSIIKPIKGSVCVSMFIKMCDSCKVKLTFKTPINNKVIKEESYSHNTHKNNWKKIRLNVDNVEEEGLKIFVTTINRDADRKNKLWAFDEIRQCDKRGFRIISSNNAARCQLLNGKSNYVFLENITENISQTHCQEDSVTNYCIPCSWIFNNECGQLTICEEQKKKILCSCSAGYTQDLPQSKKCNTKCPYRKYGYQCKTDCTNCPSGCNHVDGICGSCDDEKFRGKDCSLKVTQRPLIVSVSYKKAVIHITNCKDTSESNYILQYREEDNLTIKWITIYKSTILDKNLFPLENLKPGTKYYVRYIVTKNKSQNSFDESLPKTAFLTPCKDVESSQLNVTTFNTSAIIRLQENSDACPFNKSYIQTKNTNKFRYTLHNITANNIIVQNLYPNRNYSIEINEDLKLLFTTKEGVPEKVQNFVVVNISTSSVHLSWEAPKIYGVLKHYVIEYDIISFLGCKRRKISSNPNNKKTSNTSIILNDLVPYANYSFSIFAVNSNFNGNVITLFGSTHSSPLTPNENIPHLEELVAETHSIQIKFTEINCTKIKGSMTINITSTCLENWCTDKNKNIDKNDLFEYSSSKTSHKLKTSLLSFSHYKLKIKCCRENNCRTIVESKNIQTKAAPPSTVRAFLIYSKNDSSISIRWLEPYPPSGNLEKYKINYNAANQESKSKTVKNSPCILWADYRCFTLTNLNKNTKYSIQIQAKNKEVDNYGQSILVGDNIITKTEQSKRPLYISVDWTLQNDLQLTWSHPIEANGYITHFNISVLPQTQQTGKNIYNTFNVPKHNSTYKYRIKQEKLLPSTNYRIAVQAFNGLNGEVANIRDLSPPQIPYFESKPKLSTTNNTINIKLPKIKNANKNFQLFLLIQENHTQYFTHPKELQQFESKFGNQLSKYKILYNCSKNLNSDILTISSAVQTVKNCTIYKSFHLKNKTNYNITLVLSNSFNNKSSYNLYSFYSRKLGDTLLVSLKEKNLSLLYLLVLLPIIIIIVVGFAKRDTIKKLVLQKDNSNHLEEEQIPLDSKYKIYSKKIKVNDLEKYIKESLKNGELERQHALFSPDQTKPWDCGALPVNKSKNRYTNLLAYDHTRVILKNNKESDYINANYIEGYKVTKAYIATQGPKLSTIPDFWKMIWQENVRHIFMLANVYEGKKKKVEKYWPDADTSLQYGEITIEFISTKVFTDYEHRTFKVICQNINRTVQQYHFLSWPDHGVPHYSQTLIPFLQNLHKIPLSADSPIVVHCSAGVGRTGTVILCDINLRMAANENCVDLLRTLRNLREQRAKMVDNIQQYKLAHLVVFDFLFGIQTGIPCSEIEKIEKLLENHQELSKQFNYLKKTIWQDQVLKFGIVNEQNQFIAQEKNRFYSIVPDSQSLIYLSPYPYSDKSSIYINAVTVDGYKQPNRFIVTQQPMPNTIGDFWRLVHEKEISIILSLNEIDLNNSSSCYFWPSEEKNQLKPVDFITLKHDKTQSLETYEITTIHMYTKKDKDHKVVEIMSMKNWPASNECPEKIENLLSFWEEAYSVSRNSKQVVVTCLDGVLASGLYVSVSLVLEKIKAEQICDVCEAVRIVRHNRKQLIKNEKQFAFLYKAAVAYINGFQLYANFK